MFYLRSEFVRVALRYFFIYFFGIWVITAVIRMVPTLRMYFSGVGIAILLVHILFLSVLSVLLNRKYHVLSRKVFNINIKNILGASVVGFGLGGILPLVSNVGMFMDEKSFIYRFTEEQIRNFAAYYQLFSKAELVILIILGTVIFSIVREIFFRGLLFPLYGKEFNVNRATTFVSLLFVLVYYLPNQLDFLSLFLFSVFLCFITYQSKSLFPAIFASMCYDIPYIMMVFNETFYENPFGVMVFQKENMGSYLFYAGCVFIGGYLIYWKQNKKMDVS